MMVLTCGAAVVHAQQETTFERVQRTGSITLVADRNNLPYASMDLETPGVDVALAMRLADTLGIRLYYKWINTQFESPLNEIIKGEADLALGVAHEPTQVDAGGATIGDRVRFTIPYYLTGYVPVVKPGTAAPASFRQLGEHLVGIERGAFAERELEQRGATLRAYPNQMAVLAALRRGTVAVGALWADAGYLLQDNPLLGLRIARGFEPEEGLRVNIGGAVYPEEDGQSKIRLCANAPTGSSPKAPLHVARSGSGPPEIPR